MLRPCWARGGFCAQKVCTDPMSKCVDCLDPPLTAPPQYVWGGVGARQWSRSTSSQFQAISGLSWLS